LAISFGFNIYSNLIIALTGLCLYFFYRKDLNLLLVKKIFLYVLIFFSLLLISKTHEDFTGYHIQSINDIFYNKLTFGIANFNINVAHTSLLSYVQALYFLPLFNSKLIHIPVFLIFFSTLGYFYVVLKNQNIKKNETFFSCFIIFVLIAKFGRLSEYGYDYIAQFIILIVFHKLFFKNEFVEEFYKAIALFAFAVCIKIISFFAFPLVILGLSKKLFKSVSYKFIFLILIIGSFLTFNSFVRTGCIFYPINVTCLEKNVVSWSVKKEIKRHSSVVELWAKGFMAQDNLAKSYIAESDKYLSNFNWVGNWISVHFFYKVYEYLLILIFIYFLLLFFLKEKIIFLNFNKKNIITILISGFATFAWFNTAPQFRFGFASIAILTFFILRIFISSCINIQKKSFSYLLIILLIFFNVKNVFRINKEVHRTDLYQYKNFPWINENILEKKFSYKSREVLDKKFFKIIQNK